MSHPLLQGKGPLYQRLAEGLRRALDAGQYRPGDRLPSARHWQTELRLSLNTVHQALRLLEAEGRVEVRAQAGTYVLPSAPTQSVPPKPIPVRRSDLTLRLLREMNQPELTRLGGSIPNPDLLPTQAIRRWAARLGREGFPNRYDLPSGTPLLRQQIARLALGAGLTVSPDDVLLTSGAQEALVACLATLCREGDTVAVESPTFYGYLEVLELLRLHALEVPSDAHGLCVATLRTALERHQVACVLVTPNFSNPQGALLSPARRQELVELGVPIVENDVQGELGYAARPPALRALSERVLYCSSFSKTLGPETRVGWVLAGPRHEALERQLTFRGFGSSALGREAVGRFLATGAWSRWLTRARRTYARQARLVHALLSERLPRGSRVGLPEGGKMLWVELPDGRDASLLYRQCREFGITLSPGAVYATDDRYRHCFRVNCSYWDASVEAGLAKLSSLCRADTSG